MRRVTGAAGSTSSQTRTKKERKGGADETASELHSQVVPLQVMAANTNQIDQLLTTAQGVRLPDPDHSLEAGEPSLRSSRIPPVRESH
jgi:hypothetical protein